ncbi:hypothetical protein A2738_00650 [Candidatus Nomurabacteria bacterium RIFCSPHIGHO2_01_FULL_42_15]|uniref:Uncharacterized protein n=1 Tax=Candidatus Nomurabacteria bacterium RIFCSPHIGHO2_01_FULL_42_15 TaxID=1801742 RepID=A0A1F6VFF6_9BACT|nr:MAG: hypothetical protein A2738_00650 [Candidatus Nomurabacteria bacterium RIFCSPHIGHO2_01_FULL_42_15]OGI93193.1 MAG: hypothetical protein A3A99_01520 [Candidatus Nomurabacteria bacterium RIFCSPLOWO2_01_FULL_41_18]
MQQKRYVLKFGIVVGILYLIIFCADYFLKLGDLMFIFYILPPLPFLPFSLLLFQDSDNIMWIMSTAAFIHGFVFGSLIGAIYEKYKERKNRNTPKTP